MKRINSWIDQFTHLIQKLLRQNKLIQKFLIGVLNLTIDNTPKPNDGCNIC